jgi:predicted dehydrogenase
LLDETVQEYSFLGFTVATPDATHYLCAMKIIKAGKHVLVENPLRSKMIMQKSLSIFLRKTMSI